MSEPQTEAGRTLLRDEMWERLYLALGGQSAVPEDMFAEAILAIEAEARDAVLDALEAAVHGITGIRAVQGVRFDNLMISQDAVLKEIKKLRRQP